MAVRPAQIRYLAAGKALGASIHSGWAATWNWVLSWIAHFKPGKGLSVTGAQSGFPRLDVLIEGADGIKVTCAGDGQPYVISGGGSGGGCDCSLTGNKTGSVTISGPLTFASASDANVMVTTSGSTITIGVYWV